jgi:acetamidase/formamidase
MCSNCDYTIHGRHFHYGWNNANPPAERVAPGATVFFECHDSSGGQLTAGSTVADVPNLDFGKINPVTGPIFVEGAEPGDALKVTIEEFKPSGFGWTANIPGFGLLADQFKEPALQLWNYDPATMAPSAYGKHGRVPLKPFAGTIGCAPGEPGQHSIVPPRRVGGNLDIRDLSNGTILYLPVEVAGGLFSVGDTHAAQGDGEVCGTAIESPMNVVLKLDLVKDARLKTPRFTTPGPVTRHLDAKGYEVTTGIGPDLMEGARAAVSDMIELLAGRYNLNPVDAYMLVSTCGDLRISEIVDMPNWVVSFYFPRVVFE